MKKRKKILLLINVMVLIFIFNGCSFNKKANVKEETDKAKTEESSKAADKKPEEKKAVINRNFDKEPLIYNDKSVPVLYYHSIDYEKGNELRLPKEQFEEQMKYLKDNGYTTLTLDELNDFLTKNKPVPSKSVVITFDDGYVDNYTNAFPIMKKYGIYATIFAVTSNIDKDKRSITSQQIKEMESSGVYTESHTVNHDDLSTLATDAQVKTLKESKETLEKITGRKITYIAYPYGKFNDSIERTTKDSGYNMAFTTKSGWSKKENGLHKLSRVYVSADYSMNEFKRRLSNPNYDKK